MYSRESLADLSELGLQPNKAPKVLHFSLKFGDAPLLARAMPADRRPVITAGFGKPHQWDVIANDIEEPEESLVGRRRCTPAPDLAVVGRIQIERPIDLFIFQRREVLREIPGSQKRRSSLDRPDELGRDRFHMRLSAGE